MKTDTRLKLIDVIKKRGPTRPVDLARMLGISPQALHRQLRSLVADGSLVLQGGPPKTRYALAGIPDFSKAFKWSSAPKISENLSETVCGTRDVFTARLSHLKELTQKGLDTRQLPLLISTVGEVGNNCFDHNLGQWSDVPGCWFEVQVTGNRIWICIADRGQGIYSSIVKADPAILNEQTAIEVAFERYVSGRAPEKRGNGLKFVKEYILKEQRGLSCLSGKGNLNYGSWGKDCDQILKNHLSRVKGTFTLMVWRLG